MKEFLEDRIFHLLWIVFIGCMTLILTGAIAAPVLECFQMYRPAHFLYRFYQLTCHQAPTRSWFICGAKMGICVRCLGIYVGLIAAGSAFFILPVRRWFLRRSFLRFILPLSAGLFLPLLGDGFLQLLTPWESINPLRFITGALTGAGSALILGYLFGKISETVGYVSRK